MDERIDPYQSTGSYSRHLSGRLSWRRSQFFIGRWLNHGCPATLQVGTCASDRRRIWVRARDAAIFCTVTPRNAPKCPVLSLAEKQTRPLLYRDQHQEEENAGEGASAARCVEVVEVGSPVRPGMRPIQFV